MKKIYKLICALLGILLFGAIAYLYDPLPENPSAAVLAKTASKYKVEIIRDDWGVPHIFGDRDADVAFGLAYAHGEDDFETIQQIVAVTRGQLAQYYGKDSAPTDFVVQFMNVWQTIDEKYETIPKDVIDLVDAYAAGLNLYAANHSDATFKGLAPFYGKDIIAGFIFKTPFFYGFDKTLEAAFSEERKAELALSPSTNSTSFSWRKNTGQELGSNAIAINSKRSTDNTTRLLINSHQPLTGPVAWYEAHLVSKEGWDITGGLFPGSPCILHGFNKNLGWANTVNKIDLVDTYQLKINPKNKNQYRLDGKWLDFEKKEVTIKVKLFGPFYFPAKRTVYRSKHGPVAITKNDTVAVRYAGINEIRQMEQYYRLNKAQNMEEFMNAMKMNALPSINYTYADKDDNIAFIHNAQFPKRNNKWNWKNDLPGDTSALIWQEYHPFSKVPKLVNPESGLAFNTNNSPFVATDGNDNLKASDFPQSMGLATDFTNRARRVLALVDDHAKISKERLLEIKFDTKYDPNSKYYLLIEKILKMDWKENSDLNEIQNQLKNWNRDTTIENRQTALAVFILTEIFLSENPEDHSNERLKAVVLEVSQMLKKKFGRIDPEWGEVNRLIRGKSAIALNGGPDVLRAVYLLDETEDGKPYATNGDSWIAMVQWDSIGKQSADVIHQFGTANDENSKHYNDQSKLFADQKWRKAILERKELEESGFRAYRPKFDLK